MTMVRRSNPKQSGRSSCGQTLLLALLLPVLGFFLGAAYSFPAIWITKGREPWLTLLLGIALACTVVAVGCAVGSPLWILAFVWIFCMLLLLGLRALFGGLDRNVERFGFVHMAAVVILLWVPILTRPATVAEKPEGALPRADPVMDAHIVPGDGSGVKSPLGVEGDT